MKRSEMVKLMTKKYVELTFGEWSEATDSERMERVLQLMEDVGIRPPLWDNYRPSQAEKSFSSDSDWTYHGKKEDGTRIYSLECGYWEDE